jgi:hypothetical protein
MPAYETKVILKMTSKIIANSESLESAYNAIADSAKDADVILPSYEEAVKEARGLKGGQQNV